jgi:hypothetical protein
MTLPWGAACQSGTPRWLGSMLAIAGVQAREQLAPLSPAAIRTHSPDSYSWC